PISPQVSVAILVTNAPHVEHRSVTIPSGLNVNDLEKLVHILNVKLYNVPIIHLEKMLETEIYNLMRKHINQYDHMYTYLKSVMRYEQPVKVCIGGQTNLLTQQEFRDIEKIY